LDAAWRDGRQNLFVATDDSDAKRAADLMRISSPDFPTRSAPTRSSRRISFSTESNGALTPVPGQWPVFGAGVLEDDYTPLWNVENVIAVCDAGAEGRIASGEPVEKPGGYLFDRPIVAAK
jgi:hypothetical protein